MITRCLRYDFANFNSKPFADTFSLVHLNVCSVVSKFDEVCIWINSLIYKPSVLCQIETWYLSNMPPCPLAGYRVVSVPCSNRIGGGVCLYICNSFIFSIETLSCSIKNFEYAVILFQNPLPKRVTLVYKPPIFPLQAFLNELNIL